MIPCRALQWPVACIFNSPTIYDTPCTPSPPSSLHATFPSQFEKLLFHPSTSTSFSSHPSTSDMHNLNRPTLHYSSIIDNFGSQASTSSIHLLLSTHISYLLITYILYLLIAYKATLTNIPLHTLPFILLLQLCHHPVSATDLLLAAASCPAPHFGLALSACSETIPGCTSLARELLVHSAIQMLVHAGLLQTPTRPWGHSPHVVHCGSLDCQASSPAQSQQQNVLSSAPPNDHSEVVNRVYEIILELRAPQCD